MRCIVAPTIPPAASIVLSPVNVLPVAATTSTPAIPHSVDVGVADQETVVALGAVAPLTKRFGSVESVNQRLELVAVRAVTLATGVPVTQTEMFPEAPVRDNVGAPEVPLLVPDLTKAVATDVVTPPLKDIASRTTGTEFVHVAFRVLFPVVGLTNPHSWVQLLLFTLLWISTICVISWLVPALSQWSEIDPGMKLNS